MEYNLINKDGSCGGSVGTEPTHNNWTLTPYLGGLIREFWNGTEWIETATAEEIQLQNEITYNELNIEYTQRISDLVTKHVQKFIIDGTKIPQEVIDERERLKQEFYELANKAYEVLAQNEVTAKLTMIGLRDEQRAI